MSFRVFLLASVSLLLIASQGQADSFRPPAVHLGPKVSIQAYGKQNPACMAWTNGCVLCVSSEDGSRCSTPGIACEPHGITCKDMRGK